MSKIIFGDERTRNAVKAQKVIKSHFSELAEAIFDAQQRLWEQKDYLTAHEFFLEADDVWGTIDHLGDLSVVFLQISSKWDDPDADLITGKPEDYTALVDSGGRTETQWHDGFSALSDRWPLDEPTAVEFWLLLRDLLHVSNLIKTTQ